MLEHVLNGLYYGSILFMIASGMTIIFGVLGILNLAHGELYALGAFSAFSIIGFVAGQVAAPTGPVTAIVFGVVVLAGSLATAAVLLPVGGALEAAFIRPIYDRDEVYQLLLTYGLLLVLTDVMKFVWGPSPVDLGVFGGINEIPTTELVGIDYPSYNVFVILIGIAVFAWLVWFFDRTKTGRIVRATAINREMSTAIGISTDRMFTLVFAIGAFFAGFGGAMVSIGPGSASLGMGLDWLVLSFVVIVIGGLGSLNGAFVGSMLVGVSSRVVTPYYPQLELAVPFLLMVLVLLLKPEGLYGAWGEIQ
ncbi:branched-chain amino acid ABC transporter permease [Natrinema salsiterrestre]|uniref:Branched-chain amino acid ABC transporter permease n=1 Tax=Natrinema salsiterrestre TaxID=2950540 RepID=A0A9Q4L144_9EURY|nr:branched-chain amino acid ABC transporter permease [Natrinema salsiterrestre]MDF9745384.1 branched-chain amino acid ABC transporter permease [Natrinema salsiterrestre]